VAGLVLSVKILVAGQDRWPSAWLDPANLKITTDDQPSETMRPSQVEKICSWPRHREGDFVYEPRASLPPPALGNPGYVALLGVIIGFDRAMIEEETWPEFRKSKGRRPAAVTLSAVLVSSVTSTNGALALAGG